MAYNNEEAAHGSLTKVPSPESDRHPTHKGSMTLKMDLRAGQKVWLSGWTKTGDDGSKYLSLSAQPAQARPAQNRPAPRQQQQDYRQPQQQEEDF